MNEIIKNAFEKLKTVIVPNRCDLCGEVIFPDETRCEKCENALRIEGDICDKCGVTKENCKCDKYNFKCEYSMICSPFYFDGSIAVGIIRLKNYGYVNIADAFADEMVRCLLERTDVKAFDCVTFVPMTKGKQRRRGYNQSELLATKVADKLGLPLASLLVKVRRTKPQRKISAKERRVNLHGAFDLAYDCDVTGKTVLLIDDVKTTGSTLNECALTLLSYGAKSVIASTVAIVDESMR
ncbi:MAG: ComF family protein [Eubacterium sp.]|nr:ComF family protein [Eubacterium sp.]